MTTIYYNYYKSSSMFHGSLLSIMGTRFDVIMVIDSLTKAVKVWDKLVKELENIDKMLNLFSTDSEITKINNNATQNPVQVSPEMWKIITECQKYHKLTLGLFDITLRNFDFVELQKDAQTVFFKDEDIKLDFGGFGKGYALEKLKKIISEAKIAHAFINFGGSSVCCVGNHPHGDNWSVSIENPFNLEHSLGEIELKNKCLSVSGNIPQYKKHIVHPITGKYVDNNKIVCVTTENAAIAEVLSTTLFLSTEREKTKIRKLFKDIAIYVENEYYVS